MTVIPGKRAFLFQRSQADFQKKENTDFQSAGIKLNEAKQKELSDQSARSPPAVVV
jgi:hypothetical protein